MTSRQIVKADVGEPSLITIVKPKAQIRLRKHRVTSLNDHVGVDSLQAILDAHGAKLKLLFGASEERLQLRHRSLLDSAVQKVITTDDPEARQKIELNHPLSKIPDLSTFYTVEAATDELKAIQTKLLQHDLVDAAYIKPSGSEPVWFAAVADAEDPASTTPDFLSHQTYLNAAPGGIDAKISAVYPGGSGLGVRIIDCERGWRFTHEDLVVNQGGVIAGSSMPNVWDHGTAVLGIISGDRNIFGISGISPDATVSASSMFDQTEPVAINKAVDKLQAGDIILLERHLPGPAAVNPASGSQQGYIPIEWWYDTFVAIQLAVAKGIIVVEAGGNGSENLDAAIYNTPLTGFPTAWKNPFNPNNPSSGAIIVGAGAPPPGTHGNNHGADRSRLSFSNWGSRIDVQGWGDEVTSTGYGDLQGGTNPDLHYTEAFSGTSSASPIVTGTIANIQGVLKARGKRPLTSSEARLLLRLCGSPQQESPTAPLPQRIGKRPNLRALIPLAAKFASRSGDFDGDGKYEQFVTSSTGIAILKQGAANFETSVFANNGTRFGGWLLNTADNAFGPVADFDGDGKHEIFVVSPWGIGILKQSISTLAPLIMQPNGTRFGNGWLLNTVDNSFGPAADFDGNGKKKILVTSPWGLGVLAVAGSTMTADVMAPNGTRFDEWLLNTADNDLGQIGRFTSTSKDTIWVTSPWGMGLLEKSGSTFRCLKLVPNGTRIGGWLLNTADNRFGPVADFDGDGIAEIIVTSPWGIGMMKFVGGNFVCVMLKPNTTRFGGWLLNTADNIFYYAKDFDGDGKAELLVTSPWGVGVLKLTGDTFTAPMMKPNGTRFMPGGWLLNTANDWLGSAADYDGDRRAEVLVESPWGIGILKLSGDTMAAPVIKPNGTLFGSFKLDTAEDNFGHGV